MHTWYEGNVLATFCKYCHSNLASLKFCSFICQHGFPGCYSYIQNIALCTCKSMHIQLRLANICVYNCVPVSVCTHHTSERAWTTVAVQGTGKESGGKGVTAVCWLLHPLPFPQSTIKPTWDNFTKHTLIQTNTHEKREDNERADHYWLCFDPMLSNLNVMSQQRVLGWIQSDGVVLLYKHKN